MSYQYDADCSTLLLQTMSLLLRTQKQSLDDERAATDGPTEILPRVGCGDGGSPSSDGQAGAMSSDEGQSRTEPPTIEVTPDIKHFVEPAAVKVSPTWAGGDEERILR